MPYNTGGTMISAAAAAEPPVYDRARAVGRYAGTMKRLIHDLKFRDRHETRHLFVRWLIDAGREFWPDAGFVIPVPLHRGRLLRRRFNQSALLAREIARALSVAYEPLILHRVRSTPPQLGLTRAQRHDNMRGAFDVPGDLAVRLHGRRVVLLDDVITTGATVNACAAALRRAGAAGVDVLALAIVTPEELAGT